MSAAHAVAAVTADRVNFVDENDARGGFLALLEHVADARGAHADEHLHEIRTADGEERHIRFASDRARQQGLAGARRPDHQNALGNTATEFLKLFRITQKLNQFLYFVLGFLYAGDVAKSDLVLVTGEHARLGFTEVERAFASHPDLLAKQEIQDQEEKRDRQETDHCLRQHVGFCFNRGLHPGVGESLLKIICETQIDRGVKRDGL